MSEADQESEVADGGWLVVLRADGTVESVAGGAPVTWVGRPLAKAPGTPGVLRRAAADLVHAPPTSYVRRRHVRCGVGDAEVTVELLLVEALPLRRVHTRVRELALRTLDIFRRQAVSSAVDLTVDLAEDLPVTVLLDGEKITWALSTLVSNALRYARAHVGVHVRWDDAARELVVEVTDDGPGVPEDQRRWLFERNPATGQSAGLALLMVSDVVAAHRGSVEARSVGRGTAFTIRLPHPLRSA